MKEKLHLNGYSGIKSLHFLKEKPKIRKHEDSLVLERLSAFLPKIAVANTELESLKSQGKNINIEDCEGEAHIEMDLSLGVFDVYKGKEILEEQLGPAIPSLEETEATTEIKIPGIDAEPQQEIRISSLDGPKPTIEEL